MGKAIESIEVGEDVLYQSVQDELVLLNLRNQQYYGLDSIGTRMWHLLLQHKDAAVVADRICEEYDAEKSQILRDVEVMIQELRAAGLLKETAEGA